jgi:hypothetical protein
MPSYSRICSVSVKLPKIHYDEVSSKSFPVDHIRGPCSVFQDLTHATSRAAFSPRLSIVLPKSRGLAQFCVLHTPMPSKEKDKWYITWAYTHPSESMILFVMIPGTFPSPKRRRACMSLIFFVNNRYHLNSNREVVCCLPPAFTLVSCSAYSSTLKMEAIYSPETSVDFQRTTRRCITEDITLSMINLLFYLSL